MKDKEKIRCPTKNRFEELKRKSEAFRNEVFRKEKKDGKLRHISSDDRSNEKFIDIIRSIFNNN